MAIITPFGLFKYLFTPFGLSNASQTFLRMMDRTCAGLEDMFPYMDDSQVASPNRETHLQHLDSNFLALAANGLAINLEKCVFAIQTLEFLGHKILATGLAQQPIMRPPPPPGPQAIATCSQRGNLLLLFLAKLCPGVAPFNPFRPSDKSCSD